MTLLFVALLLLTIGRAAALDLAKICNTYLSYSLCLNESVYVRCLDAEGSIGTCQGDMMCLCGRISAKWSSPCGFDFATLSEDCEGHAGAFVSTETDMLYSPQPGTTLGPTNHLPLALFLQDPAAWPHVISYFTSRTDFDDALLYTPFSNGSSCSIHSRTHLLVPTQFFLGIPSESVLSENEEMSIRIPDKKTAMILAFAMDHFGISPAWLLGLAAATSGLPLVPTSWNVSQTITESGDWWCTSKYDSARHCSIYHPAVATNGPFQQTQGALALDISAMADTLGWTDMPVYSSRHWFEEHKESLATYHASLVQREAWRAILAASVHAQVLHTATSLLPGLRWGDGSGEVEAVSVAWLWESALNETQMALLQEVCTKLERASDVLDMAIYIEDVLDFIEKLRGPEQQALFWRDEVVDWSTMEATITMAFNVLGARRAQISPELEEQKRTSFISLRYDWRLLLAIIRAYLPPREPLIGPSIGGMHKLYGPVAEAAWPDQTSEYPSLWCGIAGGFEQLCQAPHFSEAIDSEASNSKNSNPSSQEALPNDAAIAKLGSMLLAAAIPLLMH